MLASDCRMASFKNDFLSTLYYNNIGKFIMHQYLYGYNQNNVLMMMMMMMMTGWIKLILKTIRCTCTKSQHYDCPIFFVCPIQMVSWSEISILQRKLFADLQRWLVSCYCVIIAQIK